MKGNVITLFEISVFKLFVHLYKNVELNLSLTINFLGGS